MHSGNVIRQCSVACGHFVWQLTVFVWIKNHSKTTQDSAKMCVPVLIYRQLQEGFAPWPPQQWRIKMGPRALRIEVGHGHAAPFLIDMFVYRMITPYCTKFDRLTNRKFMEIVGTRDQILMAKCTKIDFGWGSAPDPLVGWGGGYPLPIPYPLGASLLTPSAFGCLTEAKAHPTSSFWRRHWTYQLKKVKTRL